MKRKSLFLIFLFSLLLSILILSTQSFYASETDVADTMQDIKETTDEGIAYTGADIQFYNDFLYTVENNVVTIVNYASNDPNIVVPDEINSMRVMDIEENAFTGFTETVNITIPYSVTDIDENAFSKSAKVTINGFSNSTAQTYAKSMGYSFVSVDLKTPVIDSVKNTKDGIKISWEKVDNAHIYRVFYRRSSTTSWKKLTDTEDTSAIDPKLTTGVKYFYTVRCVDKYSNYLSGYNKTGLSSTWYPALSLNSATIGDNKVTLKWTKIDGVPKYRILYKRANWTYWKKVTDTTSSSYVDSSFTNNTIYIYTIAPLDKSGNIANEYEYDCKTIKYNSTPTNIKASAYPEKGKVLITWDAVEGVTKYQLYYKRLDRDTSWKKLAISDTNSFLDYGCANNKTYTYTVRCLTSDGTQLTSWYNASGGSIHFYQFPDQIKVVNYSNKGKIKISWNKIDGASKYKLYYKRANSTMSWKTVTTITGTSYIDTGCSDQVTYVYTVRACNSSGTPISSYDRDGESLLYRTKYVNKIYRYVSTEHSCSIPLVDIDHGDIVAINHELLNLCKDWQESHQFDYSIDYRYGFHNGVFSLVIEYIYNDKHCEYAIINIDINSGNTITDAEFLKNTGYSSSKIKTLTETALKTKFISLYGNPNPQPYNYALAKANTLSSDNIDYCIYFYGKNDNVMTLAQIFSYPNYNNQYFYLLNID